jgi:hypothetical protein
MFAGVLKGLKNKMNILIEDMFAAHFEEINVIRTQNEKSLESKDTIIQSLQQDIDRMRLLTQKQKSLFKSD